MLLTHGLSVKSSRSRIPGMSLTLLSGTLPAVIQFSTLFKRDGFTSLGMWHVRTLNKIIIGSMERRSNRPVIGGDLVDALVQPGCGRLILMYSQSPLGSIQPGERPATTCSGGISSTRPQSIMGHTTEEKNFVGGVEICPFQLTSPVAINTVQAINSMQQA